MIRGRLGTAAAILAVLGLVGCSGGSSSDLDIIRIGNGTEPEGLDPHIVTGIPEHHILLCLFEGLVRMDPGDLSIIPGVAERWEVSEDGKTYTFHLRADAKWSNGDSLTSEDFLYAWQRMLTPTLASEYAYMLYPMENARAFNVGEIDDFSQVGCEAPDERTLIVRLENPTPTFLSMHGHYSWFPVHRETIEQFGPMDDRTSKWTRPGNLVGNGPYVLSKWIPNSVIEVRPNRHYWDADGMMNGGVNFYPVNEESTEERMFRAGELDITESVPQSKAREYLASRPEIIRVDPWIGCYFYRVNVTRGPLQDVRVRQALAMTIDREAICTQVVQTGQKPAYFLTPPDLNGYTATAKIPHDPERARQLLADAGYPGGRGFPSIDILYNTMEQHKIVAEAIQQMWKTELGIDVTLTNQEWKVYLNSTSNERLDFDLARAGWIGDVVDPINFLECFISDNGNNRTGWRNAEYDRLLAEAITKSDLEERNALYDAAETLLMQELPILPIYHYARAFLADPAVRGYDANILAYRAYHQIYLDDGVDNTD
jgi:oligopeptide transport system substrate-binding protein